MLCNSERRIPWEEIAIMNIYNPPGYRSNFLSTSFSEVIDLNVRNTFIGAFIGDFNCHLNPSIDKSIHYNLKNSS